MSSAPHPRRPASAPPARGRALVCALLALALTVAPGSLAAAETDRELYLGAETARRALEGSASRRQSRREWDRVIARYREVVHRYPRSGYSDNALLAIGDLSHEVAERFGLPAYDAEAVKAYRMVVSEYPSSSQAEQALFSAFEIDSRGSRARGTRAARDFLARYPRSSRANQVRSYLSRDTPPPTRSASAPTGLVDVENLRFWSGEDSTRVVLDLVEAVPVKYDQLHDPERLYLDLIGTRLSASLTDRAFPVGDGLLEQIRIGQNRPEAVRVVLDLRNVKEHRIFYLKAPARLVIDVRGDPPAQSETRMASADAAAPQVRPTPAEEPSSPSPAESEPASELPAPEHDAPAVTPPRTASADPPTDPTPPPTPPKTNSTGSYSMARQLGLGARRIVIDPGHGGHDPGTLGHDGLREKDLVLDVALRLEKLLREKLGAEVVMTRRTDVFIPLEERTAIANKERADLFLSIHANSARNRTARGIETYYLNFAADSHAEEVAARENAISRATLKDLQDLVSAITLNNKIDESRDFAKAVQSSMVGSIRSHYDDVRDRGVRTAPFYVLIGANMPSILAELAFISNPTDARRLRESSHRDVVATSLLQGVESYLDALNRNQARQLTAASPPNTVDGAAAGRP